MEAVIVLCRAMDYAARKHAPQRRKGDPAEPYINHPVEVARFLAESTDGADLDLVVAGLLHDVLEDTETRAADLENVFGAKVTRLVLEVTDDKSLPSVERKRLQIQHAPTLSPQAKQIKIADKISNVRALVASPPADWSLARQQEYLAWSRAVISGCRGVNGRLETWFDDAYQVGLCHFATQAADGSSRS